MQWLSDNQLKKISGRGMIGPLINKYGYLDSKGKPVKMVLGVNKKLLHLINSWVPFLNETGKTFAYPIALSDERPKLWKRSYLTGVGQKAIDVQRQAERLGYDYIDAQENINHFISQQGRTPSLQELDSLIPDERIREKFKRLSPTEK